MYDRGMATRCAWAKTDLSIPYHDREWGVPVHDDAVLFEFLILEGAQAGLSWETILAKRDRYREVYEGFDPARVARFTPARQAGLLNDAGIIRNRAKVAASVQNAKAFLRIQDEFASFDAYLWEHSPAAGGPFVNRFRSMGDVPAQTERSLALSRDLKKRSFNFVGPTICYAFMQAVGVVNDHLVTCPRHLHLSG